MKKTLLLIIALFLSVQFFAQDRQAVSTQMNNARFEMVQSPIMRKLTFYLDKVEGKVYQLVSTRTGGFSWEEMRIYPKDTTTYTEPTYQIYMGGIAAADTFLINTKTGRTWVLVKTSDDSTYWEEFY
ncbi:MAG: hypothetical protein K6G25_05185 [Bacteroidales bacterium]|nr:hypothetical protein [Bacteroidales bacterium]